MLLQCCCAADVTMMSRTESQCHLYRGFKLFRHKFGGAVRCGDGEVTAVWPGLAATRRSPEVTGRRPAARRRWQSWSYCSRWHNACGVATRDKPALRAQGATHTHSAQGATQFTHLKGFCVLQVLFCGLVEINVVHDACQLAARCTPLGCGP